MIKPLQGYDAVTLTGWQHFQVIRALTASAYCYTHLKKKKNNLLLKTVQEGDNGKLL